LLEGGARVIVTGCDARRSADAAETLRTADDCTFVRHDAADEASWNEVLGAVEARWCGLDALVNTVGVNEVRIFADTGHADLLRLALVNLFTTWLGSFRGGTLIARSGGGAVVNIGSMAARYASASVAPYCTAKATIAGLS